MVNGDFFRHIILAFASYLGLLGVPMPLPLPPMVEDARLLQVAPADCALFVQWFGQADAGPDGASKNRAERLAAELDVRTAIAKLVASTRNSMEYSGGEHPKTQLALSWFDQAIAATKRPGCLFVVDMKPFVGGLVVAHGEQAGPVADAFQKAVARSKGDREESQAKQIAGVEFQSLPLGQGMDFLCWAAIDGCLVLAIGEPAAKQIVMGLRGEDRGLAGSAAVAGLRAGCKVERPVLRTYASMAKIRKQSPFVEMLWQPLGVQGCEAAMAESGLEGDGWVSRTQLVLPERDGVLGKLLAKPLSQDDLALIPGDATIALALRSEEGALEDVAQGVAYSFAGNDMSQFWDRFLVEMERVSGVQLRKDLFVHADDCLVAWSSPRQGGFGFTSAMAAVPLRDGKSFTEGLTAMWDKLSGIAPKKAQELEQRRRVRTGRGYLENFVHNATKVWWVDHADRDFPFGLSWANTDKHFLMGLQPQAMRSAIDASKQPVNFDTALVRKRAVARRGNATAMLYLDLGRLLEQAYGPLMLLFQLQSDEWQSEGFDFELPDVPRLESLTAHLGSELAVLEATADGCRVVRRGALPVFDPLLVGCAVACMLGME